MSEPNKRKQGQVPQKHRWIYTVRGLPGLLFLYLDRHDPNKAPNKAVVFLGKVLHWFLALCFLILCSSYSELSIRILFGISAILMIPLNTIARVWSLTRLPQWVRYVVVVVCVAIALVNVGAATAV